MEVQPPPFRHGHRFPLTRMQVALGLIVLFGLALLITAGHYKVERVSTPAERPRFELITDHVAWYTFPAKDISSVPGPQGFDTVSPHVIEAAPYKEGAVVLVHQKGTDGVAVGLMDAKQVFSPVFSDSHDKQGLVAREDGYVAFADFVPTPPVKVIVSSPGGAPVGTVLPGASAGESVSIIKILNVQSDRPSTRSVGAGRPLGVLPDGAFIIVTPDGIERLNPATAATSPLISGTPQSPLIAAYLAEKNLAALFNPSGKKIDVYTVADSGLSAKYAYSVFLREPVTAIAFAGAERLVAAHASSTATVYALPKAPGEPVMRFPVIQLP